MYGAVARREDRQSLSLAGLFSKGTAAEISSIDRAKSAGSVLIPRSRGPSDAVVTAKRSTSLKHRTPGAAPIQGALGRGHPDDGRRGKNTGKYIGRMSELEKRGPTFPLCTARRCVRIRRSSGFSLEVLFVTVYRPKMKKLGILLTALFLAVGLPSETQAQTSFQIGPRVGIDIGDIEDPFVGVDARITSMRLPVVINPTFDYYLVGEGLTFWSLSGNLLYPFGPADNPLSFYGGVGLGIYRFSSEGNIENPRYRQGATDVGANFLFGAMLPSPSFTPFAELQYTPIFTDGSPTLFGIKGGILIGF